mmetsp:Transcript_55320/g.131997  ORF Transcript_55320/g.131997 Transcript_55320/m.131997 type:complete len:443 (+) Transcript_55320:236-1564(+)
MVHREPVTHDGMRKVIDICACERQAITKLTEALRRLTPSLRREVLQTLSQDERLSLESWMLQARREQALEGKPRPSTIATQTYAKRKACELKDTEAGLKCEDVSKKDQGNRDIDASQPTEEKPKVLHSGLLQRQKALEKMKAPKIAQNSMRGGLYHFVFLHLGCLQIISRRDRDFLKVQEFANLVSRLLKLLAANLAEKGYSIEDGVAHGTEASTVFRECFGAAALSILENEEEALVESADIRFSVSFRPLWLPRALHTHNYKITQPDLSLGLSAWRVLQEAKGETRHRSHVLWTHSPQALMQTWAGFRAAYVEVMVEGGAQRDLIEARLAPLEEEVARRQADQMEAWNRAQMAKEDVANCPRLRNRLERLQDRCSAGSEHDDTLLAPVRRLLVSWRRVQAREQSRRLPSRQLVKGATSGKRCCSPKLHRGRRHQATAAVLQ